MLMFRHWRVARRRPRAPLPAALRARLLAVPDTAARRPAMPARSPAVRGPHPLAWLLASPVTPLAAAFVLALGLSLAWGNPYQTGAATLDRALDEASPATARIRAGATTLLAAATELGESASSALPRAGYGASRAVSATLRQQVDDPPSRPRR